MTIYQNKKNNTYEVRIGYTDFTGTYRQKTKRGFKRKKDAKAWENEFLLNRNANLDMSFQTFYEEYMKVMKNKVRFSTFLNKENIFETWILPYFKNRKYQEITSRDIMAWQQALLSSRSKEGKKLSPEYLRTIQSQLSAIFNYAVKYYGLKTNPVIAAGPLGRREKKEMLFWTKDEYLKFSYSAAKDQRFYYAFEILYWCGLRSGEMMALTPEDFNFKGPHKTIRINKTFQVIKGKPHVGPPKTAKGYRTVIMPNFLAYELEHYMGKLYKCEPGERVFDFTKSAMHRAFNTAIEDSGVKKIRIHDLRHSHISLLIDMGFSPLQIGERVGHESERITLHYSHLFPSAQRDMADRLSRENRYVEEECR